MRPDDFRRLALLSAGSTYSLAVALVWVYFGWPVAVATLVGGVLAAVAATTEFEPSPKTPEPPARGSQEGLSRRGVARLTAGPEDDE